MPVYIALLRGINVGGSGLLAMKDLAAMCGKLGFAKARTYIQSGNAIFECGLKEDAVRRKLEEALLARMGKRIDVMIRTAEELRAAFEANPFPDREPAKVAVFFLAGEPPVEQLRGLVGPAGEPPVEQLRELVGPAGEQVRPGRREIYVYYPEGMGRSKLKLPLGGASATVRNVNTVAKLAALADG